MTTGPVAPEPAPRADAEEVGRPLWALLGLLTAVAIAVSIMAMGFSAA